MNDTERLKCEMEMLPKLKRHLTDVLNLRPIEGLSPLSVCVLKTSKVLTDSIGEWAGTNDQLHGIDTSFKEMLEAMKLNCTAEEVEVIQLALESFELVSEDLKCYPFSLCKSLNGDEVFWAWDFLMMSNEQIKHGDVSDGENRLGRRRVVLKRFADLDIDVLGLREKNKAESGGESPSASTIEEVEPLDRILETAAGLKLQMERDGASYEESGLSEIIECLLNELGSVKLKTEQGAAFRRLKEVWMASAWDYAEGDFLERHLPPLKQLERDLRDEEKRKTETEDLEPTLKETELAEGFVNEFILSHFGFEETTLAEVSDKVLSLYVSEKLAKTIREHPNMVTELAEAMNYDLVCIQSGDGESELKQPICARGSEEKRRIMK